MIFGEQRNSMHTFEQVYSAEYMGSIKRRYVLLNEYLLFNARVLTSNQNEHHVSTPRARRVEYRTQTKPHLDDVTADTSYALRH